MNHRLVVKIIERLRTDTAVAALVGEKVFKGKANRSTDLPYIVVNQIGNPIPRYTNVGQVDEYLFQVSSYAAGSQPERLAAQIDSATIEALNRWRDVTDPQVNILSSVTVNALEFEDAERDLLGLKVWHFMREWRIESASFLP
jgi:hypothetical protein